MRTVISELKKTLAWNYNDIRSRYYQLRYLNPPVYARSIRLNPRHARFDTGPAQETEYPYRRGTALVLRLLGPYGVTVGILDDHPDLSDDAVDNRLLVALQSADGPAEFREQSFKNWAKSYSSKGWADRVRRVISEHAVDLDEEVRLTEMLGMWDDVNMQHVDPSRWEQH